MQRILWLLCLLIACSPAPLNLEQELPVPSEAPVEQAAEPTQPVASAEPVEPESVLLAEGQSPEFILELEALPFSTYYEVHLDLFRQGEAKALYSNDFFPAEQTQQSLNIPAQSLKKGDAYSLQISGQYPENNCLTDWALLLVATPGATLPGSAETVYRAVDTAQVTFTTADFQRDAADLNCSFIYDQIGTVKDASGKALKDVSVRAEVRKRSGGVSYLNRQQSAEDGRFSFQDLPVGVFTWLVAEKKGYRTVEQTFSAQFNDQGVLRQRSQLEIVMEPSS